MEMAMAILPECNSTEPWRPMGKYLDLLVLPLVCFCGLFLNLACIVVFIKRKTTVFYYSSTITTTTTPPVAAAAAVGPERHSSPSQRSRKLSPAEICSTEGIFTNGNGGGMNGRKNSGERGGDRKSSCRQSIAMASTNGGAANGNGTQKRSSFINYSATLLRTRRHSNRHSSHPLVPVLIVLCCCDSLQLLFSLLVLYLPALHDHLEMDPLGVVAQICYLATGGLSGFLLASNCASIWTMCFISIQRHRAILRPLSTISASNSSSHFPLLLIALFALLFNAPVWFEFSWSSECGAFFDGLENGVVDGRSIICHQRSQLATNESYRFLMRKVLYPVCVYLIPLVLISFLNIRILAFLRSSSRLQQSPAGHRHRMARERRSVWLLISIVLLFFLCHTGGLVIRFVDLDEYGTEPCFIFATDFVNFLFNVNSFANPMLYFFFTKQFRDLRTIWTNHHNHHNQHNNISRCSTTIIQQQQQMPNNGNCPNREMAMPMLQQQRISISSGKRENGHQHHFGEETC